MNITTELSEILVDQIFDSELLKDIPIASTAMKIFNIGKGITDYYFLKKILLFLSGIKDIPQAQRIKFKQKLLSDNHNDVGGKLMFLIHRLDDVSKATILRNLLCAAIVEKITFSDFLRAAYSIEKIYIEDLKAINPKIWHTSSFDEVPFSSLVTFIEKNKFLIQSLYQVGLLQQYIADNARYDLMASRARDTEVKTPPKFSYKVNNTCKIIMEYGFDDLNMPDSGSPLK